MNHVTRFLIRATRAVSLDEDRARREFIFNVLALGALMLLLAAIADDTVHRLASDPALHKADSLASPALYVLFVFFAALYALSLRGRALLASYVMLAALFDLAAYMGYRWGVDLSASLLFYALAIAMAGVLIHAWLAFGTALLAGIAIGVTVHLRGLGFIQPDRGWITEVWKADDVIVATLIFLVIALVTWLSNREIERSLARARRSEADLRQERDLLEARVEERTHELRQAELERMTQAYRFIEFGRLAGGIFHDLMNPLAGLTLTIDRIGAAPESRTALSEDVKRAKLAARHMQTLLDSMRTHLRREAAEELFSASELVSAALQLLTAYARAQSVELSFEAYEDMWLFGDPVALTQAVMNLVGNAVHAYAGMPSPDASHAVGVLLARDDAAAIIRIEDDGCGIAPDALPRIFEPYFTTKGNEGIGLGLSLAKRVVEQGFGGALSVESAVGAGTVFTLYLPIREP